MSAFKAMTPADRAAVADLIGDTLASGMAETMSTPYLRRADHDAGGRA